MKTPPGKRRQHREPGMDSPPKPPAIAPWSFASATGPGPRWPAVLPLCCSSAGGQRGEDVPMGAQTAPTTHLTAHLHFLQALEAPRQGREAGLHHGVFHLGEDGVTRNPSLEACSTHHSRDRGPLGISSPPPGSARSPPRPRRCGRRSPGPACPRCGGAARRPGAP